MRGLKGKTVIVTGGASGIGAATVARFREEGSNVLVFDLKSERPVDITSYDAVKKAVDEAGPVDILVNNAGWDRFIPFLKTDPAFWQKIISLNLVGAMNMLHCVLPGMVARGGGKVVTVASDAGRVGSSGEAPYSACKGGLIALTKTLARELATKNVRLNVVCPGLTETGMLAEFMQGAGNPDKLAEAYRRAVPIGRLGKPDDIPGAILFFASDDADFITGQVLSVSGGLTMHG
ncbi:MAG TPA: SDR family oxidoreductase [Burkholderiales bacterium]|jgi:2-hydroxycyclohexanecarboxyl-CoA dehydrogenase|nr:SDR family oxidoreductase [Burkholderiales bacterium]HEX2651074.1 SDR family oxidoreductase [Burkholderiales bacterium]